MSSENPFKPQIDQAKPVTADILKNVEYKRVWSGELIQEGDIVLYAFMQTDDGPRLFTLLERELESFKDYTVIGFENEIIPVLKK